MPPLIASLPLWVRRLLILLLFASASFGLSRIKPQIESLRSAWTKKPQELYYLPAPRVLERLSLGYRTLLADLIWIRGILYVGAHFSKEEGGIEWLPQYFDSIATLDPKFERAYTWASILLVYNRKKPERKNVLSSLEILKRGREIFPEKHIFPYHIATTYMFELGLLDRTIPELHRDHLDFCKTPASPKISHVDLIKTTRNCMNRIGGRYLIEAASKADAPSNLGLIASGTLMRGRENQAIICRYLQELLWSADNDEVRENLKQRMALHCGERASEQSFCLERLFTQRWKRDFPYLPRRIFASIDLDPSLSHDGPFSPSFAPPSDPCKTSKTP